MTTRTTTLSEFAEILPQIMFQTIDEFNNMLLPGYNLELSNITSDVNDEVRVTVPQSKDWRQNNVVTNVKDQVKGEY